MTTERNFKKRVRDRMHKTGESYAAARMHLEAQRGARREGDLDAAVDGGELTQGQAKTLESRLRNNPNDVDARARLLGHHFLHQDEPAHREARRPHVLWMIRNRPELEIAGTPYAQIPADLDPDGYVEGAAAWRVHLAAASPSTTILEHAAGYFRATEPALAEVLLRKAREQAPEDRGLTAELGLHLAKQGRFEESLELLEPAAALALVEPAAGTELERESWYQLEYAASAAFRAGRFDKVKAFAEAMLRGAERYRDDWNHGNALHDGHRHLGRLALRAGDVAEAKRRLLASAETPGSPQLDTFGPNLRLAQELLDRGERETVRAFLERCAVFWEEGRERLEEWLGALRRGETPSLTGAER